jgi:hypothetical protein
LPRVGALQAYAAVADEPSFAPQCDSQLVLGTRPLALPLDETSDEVSDLLGRSVGPGRILQVLSLRLVGQHSPPVILHELAQ